MVASRTGARRRHALRTVRRWGNRLLAWFVLQDVMVMVAHEYDAVFRETYPALVSLGVLKSGRVEVARDLAQETMLRAHRRWDELSRYDAPGAWCRAVMTNLLIDHHRSVMSERRAIDRIGRGGGVIADSREQRSAMPALDRWNELVAPLSDRQRMVVTLFYADDLSVGQIAHLVGTTRGAVKATLFKARRVLRARLDADGLMHGDADG